MVRGPTTDSKIGIASFNPLPNGVRTIEAMPVVSGASVVRRWESSYFSMMQCSIASLTTRHSHSELVLGYYFAGCSRCYVGQNKSFEYQAGDVALLNPGVIHQDFPVTSKAEYLLIKIKREFFRELFEDLGSNWHGLPYFPSAKVEHDPAIQGICETLLAELSCQQFGQEALLRSLATELAVTLVRRSNPSAFDGERVESDQRPVPWQVRKILAFVHDNYSEGIPLEDFASMVGVSKYYLERMFKRAIGVPLQTYVMLLRIDRAKHLLAAGDQSLADIAFTLGFSDQSHFSNLFKRYTGLTPHSYRMNAK